MSQLSPTNKNPMNFGLKSGSIGTYGTRLGDLLNGVEVAVAVMLSGNDGTYNYYGGSFFHSCICVCNLVLVTESVYVPTKRNYVPEVFL